MKMMIRATALLGLAWLAGIGILDAAPALTSLLPQGIERGKETEVTFRGDRLTDVADILFYSPGFTLNGLTPAEDGKKCGRKITVAPEVPLGIHTLRLRSPRGVSRMRPIFVGQFSRRRGRGTNNELAEPNPRRSTTPSPASSRTRMSITGKWI